MQQKDFARQILFISSTVFPQCHITDLHQLPLKLTLCTFHRCNAEYYGIVFSITFSVSIPAFCGYYTLKVTRNNLLQYFPLSRNV